MGIDLSISIIDKSFIVNRLVDDLEIFVILHKTGGAFLGFYAMFEHLCNEKGVSPAQVRADLGISQSTMASWKSRGLTPKYDTAKKLAQYFGVEVDDLMVENFGIVAGGKIKAGGGIKSRYGIKAGGGIETGGPVEVGPGVFDDSPVRNIVFNTTPDPEWVELERKMEDGTITPDEAQRYKELMDKSMESIRRTLPAAKQRLLELVETMSDGELRLVSALVNQIIAERPETAPQSTPAPPEGKDTTPSPDVAKTPPEGE